MFVYLTMFLLFLKITSEQEGDIKPIHQNSFLKIFPQVKEIVYGNKQINLNKHNHPEVNAPHLVNDEDPEFPLYRDNEVLLDNRDAEISGQIKGIKRYVPAGTSKRRDYNISNENRDAEISGQIKGIKWNVPAGNSGRRDYTIRNEKETQNRRVKNKFKRNLTFFKLRNKRNANNNIKFTTTSIITPLDFLNENEFYDEEQIDKSQDLKDLCAYRPNEKCFQKTGEKTEHSRHRYPRPTMLVEDYFQDETMPLNKTTSSSINRGFGVTVAERFHDIINTTSSIKAAQTKNCKTDDQKLKMSIKSTPFLESTTHNKMETTSGLKVSSGFSDVKSTSLNTSTTIKPSSNKSTDSPPKKKVTIEDVCKKIATYAPLPGGSPPISTLDKVKLYCKLINKGSSNTLDINATGVNPAKSQLVKQIEDNPSIHFNYPVLDRFENNPTFHKTFTTSNSQKTNTPATTINYLNSAITNRSSETNTKKLYSGSVVNSTQAFKVYNSIFISSSKHNLTSPYKDKLTFTPITEVKKSTKRMHFSLSPSLPEVPVIKYFNSSAFEDTEHIVLLQSEQGLNLEKPSEHKVAENSSRCFKTQCKELPVTSNLNYIKYSMGNKSSILDMLGKLGVESTSSSNKLKALSASNISKVTLARCKPERIITRKKSQYKIFLEPNIQPPNVTHESIYYAYHNKTTVTRRAYTFYSVSGYPLTQPPQRKLGIFLKKLTNNSIVSNRSTTKSSVITLRHKDPCKETEEAISKPILQKVLEMIPKPTDKIPSENHDEKESVTVKHKKVYPIRHKGGDPGNHYYHGKHTHTACEHEKFKPTKCTTTSEPLSTKFSHGKNDKIESTTSTTGSQNITELPKNLGKTQETIASFITKRKIGQAQGKKDLMVNFLNGSSVCPSHEKRKCTTCHNISNDIKEILPQRFHKEYLNLNMRMPVVPSMHRAESISKVQKKPKEKFSLSSLCSANVDNKTNDFS